MANAIDYDRGVEKRRDPLTGVDVYVYQDDPGVYLNAYGQPIDEAAAAAAGFDVVKLGKVKDKKERVAAALAAIDAEDGEQLEQTIVQQRNGYKLVSIGLGRYRVLDPDGDNLTPKNLTQQEGEIVFNQLVPETKAKAKPSPFSKLAATAKVEAE